MAILVISFLKGNEERQRLMRRNIIRYVLLSYCMATRAVSFRVKKRFPDLQHLVDAGLMREDEYKVSKTKQIFFSLNTNSFHFIVCKYFTNLQTIIIVRWANIFIHVFWKESLASKPAVASCSCPLT